MTLCEVLILDEQYYEEHIEHQSDHLSKDRIREVVENPDNVYKGEDATGKTIYVWEKIVDGTAEYTRATDFEDTDVPVEGIQTRSAYENRPDKLDNLKETYDLIKIWP